MEASCDYGNEPSGSITAGKFLSDSGTSDSLSSSARLHRAS
jgi:hypothetical protein